MTSFSHKWVLVYCHSCVNLSKALWTLLSSQNCGVWPVFVRVCIYYYGYTQKIPQVQSNTRTSNSWQKVRKILKEDSCTQLNTAVFVFFYSFDMPSQQLASAVFCGLFVMFYLFIYVYHNIRQNLTMKRIWSVYFYWHIFEVSVLGIRALTQSMCEPPKGHLHWF